MISLLQGQIIQKSEKFVVLKTAAGIGFKVFCLPRAIFKLSEKNGSVNFFTHLVVRENSWEIYGFLNYEELEMFELLLTINGIGPKMALNILSRVGVAELEEAIVLGKEEILSRISGLGSKTASRIILELKSKIKKISKTSGADSSRLAQDLEIIDTLVGLGYKFSEAKTAVQKISPDINGIENKIKAALKFLAR